MIEQQERRTDMGHFMRTLEDQNRILTTQNELLSKILLIIEPVSKFFGAMKKFVIFMAWFGGLVTVGYQFWDWLKDFVKHH